MAVIPNRAPKIAPSKNSPTTPKGDVSYSFLKPIGFVVSNGGAGATDNRIGVKDNESTTDAMMNKL